MNLLALETSTDLCSVALFAGDALTIDEALVGNRHSDRLLPMAQGLLRAGGLGVRDLDLIAVGIGPGSFTGIRVAVSVGQGLAFALDVPMLPVTSTAALAQAMRRVHAAADVAVLLDARMGEGFAARYVWRDTDWQNHVPPCLVRLDALPPAIVGAHAGVGGAFADATLAARLGLAGAPVESGFLPSARDVAHLARALVEAGHTVPPADAQPLYLRDKVADTIAERAARLAA